MIRTATKVFIHDSICYGPLDSSLFVQAKEEVQEMMKEAYQLFLKSASPPPPAGKPDTTGNSEREHHQETGNSMKELNHPKGSRLKMEQEVTGSIIVKKEFEPVTANQERLLETVQHITANQKRPEHLHYR